MKKLTIEEKAKRFDEAFNEAVTAYKDEDRHLKATLERIFPELKESEDEKVKKAIIEFFELQDDNTTYSFIPKKDILAWLEKQGNKDSQVAMPTFTFDDVLALQCCMETVKKVQKDNELYEQLQNLHDRLHDAYWLEKQGEQKPIKREEFISIPFGTDSEFIKEAIAIPDGCVATIEGRKVFIRKK